MSKAISVEGWRFLPHSYAIVNQFQCLEMLRRKEWELHHRDVPFYGPSWRQTRGIFDSDSEERLDGIAAPPVHSAMDVTYRIAFPFNFKPSRSTRTFVFATSEGQYVPAHHICGAMPLSVATRDSDATIITPSRWSREGLLRSGADVTRIAIVPHGIDPEIFKPSENRAGVGSGEREFVFLNVGAMSGAKNMSLLLQAFAAIVQRFPMARLHLKGLDSFYRSARLLHEAVKVLTEAELNFVRPRLRYSGEILSHRQMAELYRSAHVYVSPYTAEAFNIPVLEACACGIPVICTGGGPTDEFTDPRSSLRIDSAIGKARAGLQEMRFLVPSLDSLIAHMERVQKDLDWCKAAGAAASSLARREFSWTAVVDRLVQVLLSPLAKTPDSRPTDRCGAY